MTLLDRWKSFTGGDLYPDRLAAAEHDADVLTRAMTTALHITAVQQRQLAEMRRLLAAERRRYLAATVGDMVPRAELTALAHRCHVAEWRAEQAERGVA